MGTQAGMQHRALVEVADAMLGISYNLYNPEIWQRIKEVLYVIDQAYQGLYAQTRVERLDWF